MKQSHRIILNTLTAYGQSVFGIALNLFSARWVLEALGQVDFGLYGVIGSIVLLITFLNQGMSVGVARFYAYSIGHGHNLFPEEAADDLKRWFNTALGIHMLLPFVLVLIGYFIGIHAIHNWLVIPTDRIESCILVFQISVVTAYVSMLSVPFVAMYSAHQYFAELALFGMASSICTFVGAYFLLTVQSDKLVVYALYMMGIGAGIPLLQILRAVFKFKACRLHIPYIFNLKYLKELFNFVGWKMFGMSCIVFRTQGAPVLINLFFGPQVNAAYSLSSRASNQANTLYSSMMRAFQPAIVTMEGRGERQRMNAAALQVCRFGTLLVIFIVIPLIVEMDSVLVLWLKNPPQYTSELCMMMLAIQVIDGMTAGHMLAINARGKIAAYELIQGLTLFFALPLMYLFFRLGLGPVSVAYALFISMVVYCIGRLIFCKKLLDLPIIQWTQKVAFPIFLLMVCSVPSVIFVCRLFEPSLWRLCIATAVNGIVIIVIGWFILFEQNERIFVICSLKEIWGKADKFMARRNR